MRAPGSREFKPAITKNDPELLGLVAKPNPESLPNISGVPTEIS
jgi:hypothetical protein